MLLERRTKKSPFDESLNQHVKVPQITIDTLEPPAAEDPPAAQKQTSETDERDQYLPLSSLIASKESGTLTFKHHPDWTISQDKKDIEEIKTMEAWHNAYPIFVSVFLEKSPELGPALMKHSSTVQNLAKLAGTYAAIKYDTQFRKLREECPTTTPWDMPNMELYNKAITDGLSFQQKFRPGQRGQTNNLFRGKRTQTCNLYNEGICYRNNCRFQHICI
ncbi:uncharacterized protein LOC132739660 [Ruditapes philippinarum]|uniref:uncharacterized protein LOC132739660 n=1 Tax=Ruditapes philippinarum TaxID=129788 RepID=UPI00295B0987|nr:uncharacterized protein LOC132739660 [Ruditapes philippinarum]